MLSWLHPSLSDKSQSRSLILLFFKALVCRLELQILYKNFLHILAITRNLCRLLFLPTPSYPHGWQGWKKNFLIWLQDCNNSNNVNRKRERHQKIPKERVRARGGGAPVRNQSPQPPQESWNFFAYMVIVRVAKLPGRNWAASGKRWTTSPATSIQGGQRGF